MAIGRLRKSPESWPRTTKGPPTARMGTCRGFALGSVIRTGMTHPQEPEIHREEGREACRRGVAFNDQANSVGDEIPVSSTRDRRSADFGLCPVAAVGIAAAIFQTD